MSKKTFKKKPELVTLPKESLEECERQSKLFLLSYGAECLPAFARVNRETIKDPELKRALEVTPQLQQEGRPADGTAVCLAVKPSEETQQDLRENAPTTIHHCQYWADRLSLLARCDLIRSKVMPLLHDGDPIGAEAILSKELPAMATGTASALSASEWLSLQDVETVEVISGLIDMLGRIALVAQSKMRKSSFILQLAVSIATGINFLGFKVKPMRTLIINGEIMEANYKKRLRRMVKTLNVDGSKLGQLLIVNASEDATTWDIDRILLLAKAVKAEVVICDPFYLLIDDETDQTQVKDCVRKMKRFAQAGITLISVFHATKGKIGDKQVIDRISGSGIFARDCSTLISLCEHASEPDHAVMTCELRNHPPQPPKTIVFKDDAFHVADEVAPVEKNSTTKQARKFDFEQVAKALDQRMTYSQFIEAIKSREGVGFCKAKELIGDLFNKGLVEKEVVGRNTFYTPKGDMV